MRTQKVKGLDIVPPKHHSGEIETLPPICPVRIW